MELDKKSRPSSSLTIMKDLCSINTPPNTANPVPNQQQQKYPNLFAEYFPMPDPDPDPNPNPNPNTYVPFMSPRVQIPPLTEYLSLNSRVDIHNAAARYYDKYSLPPRVPEPSLWDKPIWAKPPSPSSIRPVPTTIPEELWYCPARTKEACADDNCDMVHLKPKFFPYTDVSLGDCPYLDECRRPKTCKFVHYERDPSPDGQGFGGHCYSKVEPCEAQQVEGSS